MELLQTLTTQLGVSEEQAKGGAGLLFKMAREKLGAEDFGKVVGAVPGIGELIASAPESGSAAGAMGGLGGLMSSLGGSVGQLGSLASLTSGFRSLNLDASMVSRFMPIVLTFVQNKGGDAVKNILEKALK